MNITNEDNMELMARYEDNHFDLAIVDPPYGISVQKQNGSNDMADAELAWSSFETSVRMYRGHIFKGIGCTNYKSIHPTQKPVKLYEWLLMNYAKEGDKILDTHLGSGSIAIACHNLKFDLTACELDTEYFDSAIKRINQHKQQLRLW